MTRDMFGDLSIREYIDVKCVACQRPVKIRYDQRRLCLRCRGDIPGLRERAEQEVAQTHARCEAALAALDAALEAADDRLSERWGNYMVAVSEGDPKVAQADQAALSGMAGPMPDLIRLWLKFRDVLREATLVEEAARRILEETE